jgi:FixJ family two-component response regulator
VLRALVALLVAVTLAAAGNENLATADGGTLRRSGINAPVIFITAHDEPSAREQADRADAVAYLPRPFPGRHLVDAVNRALALAVHGSPHARTLGAPLTGGSRRRYSSIGTMNEER